MTTIMTQQLGAAIPGDQARLQIEALAKTDGYIELRALERLPSNDSMEFRGSRYLRVNGQVMGLEQALTWATEQDSAGYEVFIGPNLRARRGRKKVHVQ